MAPEVLSTFIDEDANVYRFSDIYAFGLVTWEMLTRTRPNQIPLGESGWPERLLENNKFHSTLSAA